MGQLDHFEADLLTSFVYHYPIAGRTVQELVRSFGSVTSLIDRLSTAGFGKKIEDWLEHYDSPLTLEQIRKVFGDDRLELIANRMGITLGAVSSQIMQYLPKFISRMGDDEDLQESGFLPWADAHALKDQIRGRLHHH